jgi:hypothetical protein
MSVLMNETKRVYIMPPLTLRYPTSQDLSLSIQHFVVVVVAVDVLQKSLPLILWNPVTKSEKRIQPTDHTEGSSTRWDAVRQKWVNSAWNSVP